MKSGKHFNASESLDNLPLTHPEHFGTPVGSRRRGRVEEEEEESSEVRSAAIIDIGMSVRPFESRLFLKLNKIWVFLVLNLIN